MYEKAFEIKHFLVFHYPEEPKSTVPGPLELLGMVKGNKQVRLGRLDVQFDGGQEAKTEILV